ncbi:AEC family transporter [Thalassospira sp.]|uniref:AEC family transporter n=1 Tax=Thalassospira sp. TaxID=1912094 RepID=UPI000C3629EA|nr:AEC family transporter [Thalassospira sp.]MBC07528.1 permease [Thalassospira sp.]|tara:strand:+ start:12044 stop:13000 length:957 start_codon:yes stop_codon:yes gene_type:complete
MLDILAITTPIFLLIAIGYIAVYRNIVPQPVVRGMGAFVINFALPCLLIRALIVRDITEVLNIDYLAVYGAGSLIVFALGYFFARVIAKKSQQNAALQGMGMSASNSGFVGYPIVVQLLGPTAAVALALCFIIENLVITPLTLILGDSAQTEGANRWHIWRKTFVRLGRNPIIVALLIGLSISVSGITLPGPIFSVVDMLASASGPVALFVIGGGLVGLKLRGVRFDMARIVFGKLILHPLIIFLLLGLVPDLDPLMKIAAVTFACAPMFSVYAIYGQRYGHEGMSAAALMAATLLSFITISISLWLLDSSAVFGQLP